MADLCDDPFTIKEMYKKINNGYDVVCGSRYMPEGSRIGGPKLKAFFSRFVGVSLHYLIRIPTRDIANAFKLYRKNIFDKIEIKSNGFEVSMEMPLRAYFKGYSITEVPTVWQERKSGKSHFKIIRLAPRYFKWYIWALYMEVRRCFMR